MERAAKAVTFPIAETSVNIPDFSVPAICDFSEEVAEDSVVFEGGFASPGGDIISLSCSPAKGGIQRTSKCR